MADVRALVFDTWPARRIQSTDALLVGNGIKTESGNLTITPSGASVLLASGKGIVSLGGGANFDFSSSSGTFSTPTGSVAIGPGAVTISGATTITSSGTALAVTNNVTIGGTLTVTGAATAASLDRASAAALNLGTTNASAVNISKVGAVTTILGDLVVQGTETVVSTTIFQQNATFEGNVTFGNQVTDTVAFTARVGPTGNQDIHFVRELDHVIDVDASTTAATAGGAITLRSGNGNGAAGGALTLDAGSGSVGGALFIGTTNASTLAIGRTGAPTTIQGPLLGLSYLNLDGIAAPAVSASGEARVYVDSSTNKIRVSENGSPYQDLISASAGVTGSGAVNQVAFWSGVSALSGEAALFWDSTNDRLGVNTNSPAVRLHAYHGGGAAAVARFERDAADTAAAWIEFKNSDGELGFIGKMRNSALSGERVLALSADGTTNHLTIAPGGNVGMGTGATSPIYPLEILKSQNGASLVVVSNATNGTAAQAGFFAGTGTNGVSLTYRAAAFTSPATFADAGVLYTDSAVTGGLILATQHASAPMRFLTGATPTEALRIDASQRVQIGGSPSSQPATTPLMVSADSAAAIKVESFNNTAANTASLVFLRGRDGRALPTPANSGDSLGSIDFQGQHTAASGSFSAGARILVETTEAWGAGARGSRLTVATVRNGQTALENRVVFTDDDVVIQAATTLATTGTGNINLPNNGSARFQIEGSAVGSTVTATNLGTLTTGVNADALHSHSTSMATGFTTTGLADGDFGYISAANTVAKTDAVALATARCVGANEGVVGSMTVAGFVENAKFTTDGGSPSNGAAVYLALASADGGTGAGKLTATPPSGVGEAVAEIGLCADNSNYAGSKTAKVVLQVKIPIVN